MPTVGNFKVMDQVEKEREEGLSSFSLLAALFDLNGHHENLTEQDKKILHEVDPLFEGVI